MHGSIMEWTNDDALQLIEQYRSHTELWNRADPKYKDKLCRFRAWSTIADRFGCSKAEVERKMNVLLTQYRREKHKMLVKLYQGIQPNPSKWYAFKRFDFMEAGGGCGSMGSFGSLNAANSSETNIVNSALSAQNLADGDGSGSGCSADGIKHPQTTNGRQHNHCIVQNGETTTTYVSTSNAVTASSMPISAHHPHHSHPLHHRRVKGKEMKYFGAMGLNLPILLATSQSLDTWGGGTSYSSPTHELNQMRVQLPLPFSAPQADLNLKTEPSARPSSFFGDSSVSDILQQAQKPIEDIEDHTTNRRCMSASAIRGDIPHYPLSSLKSPPTPAAAASGSNPTNLSSTAPLSSQFPANPQESSEANVMENRMNVDDEHISHNGRMLRKSFNSPEVLRRTAGSGNSAPNSPMSDTPDRRNSTLQEAEKQTTPTTLTAKIRQQIPHNLSLSNTFQHHSNDLNIKQELLMDYFDNPHPPETQRLYAAADDPPQNEQPPVSEFAQDLRVHAGVAATENLEFSRFVLRSSDARNSIDCLDDRYRPLNMQKLNNNHGIISKSRDMDHMIMGSFRSRENLSEDNNISINCVRRKSGSLVNSHATLSLNGLNGTKIQDGSASETAIDSAAAIYVDNMPKDDCDFIGSNVSTKLRGMERAQRIIAEKLISEVLYYGQFRELERTAHILPK